MKTIEQLDPPVGWIGVLHQQGRFYAGWRMSQNYWIKPGIKEGKYSRFDNVQIPIDSDAEFLESEQVRDTFGGLRVQNVK